MKYIFIVILFLYACGSCNEASTQKKRDHKIHIDRIMNETQYATLLFHHQIHKMSLVAKEYNDRKEIDSLFSIIGNVSNDTSCSEAGLFNHFGEIQLYKDSVFKEKNAVLYFVLNGDCEGVYLEIDKRLNRFELTKSGKELIERLYRPHRNRLK